MSPALTSAMWDLGRGTGVVALTVFTLALVLGILARSGRDLPGLGRFEISDLHRAAALTGVGLIVVHVSSMLLDPFAQLKLVDVVLPFLAAYRPLWLGLGTLAFDVLVVVTVVSLLRQRVGPKVFRSVHWATYALWPLALFHSLGSGTNATTSWFRGLAAVCVVAVVGAVWWRISPSFAGRGWTRRERKTI
jgi:methionine sulfoxide reductase heme-binding subunit